MCLKEDKKISEKLKWNIFHNYMWYHYTKEIVFKIRKRVLRDCHV